MPPLASAVEPEQTVSRSSTTIGPTPSRARWYAVLTPMMPAPTMTTSAVCATPAPYAKREAGSTDDLNRCGKAAIMGAARSTIGEGGQTHDDDRSGVGHGGGAVTRVRSPHAFTGRCR